MPTSVILTISDENGPVLGAMIDFLQNGSAVASTITDSYGKARVSLEPGIYQLEATYRSTRRGIGRFEVASKKPATFRGDDIVLSNPTFLRRFQLNRYRHDHVAITNLAQEMHWRI